ncbi:M20 aminoacylase family protein [Sinisalibacter aestuarii]|uniref:Amidohydrolase n=1 Tax=Sinisalibacter aestuarii TaxID=2949426 RepID=A0ABQ5LRY5_9RHOB|nr:M20 aminoacylase family protein [Sinisalibacter aestuarii]GKY87728.1 amidohydrolase [Sinisalibacter aestuarii]
MPILNRINDLADEIAAWRHDFHAHPELMYEEHRTAARVAELLRSFGVDEVATGLGKTGVVGIIRGSRPGATIGLRADMDALPIEEASEAEYASQQPGKMHACGHDGHTAMLLGAAKYLAETRDFAGSVAVIFQPAEEGGAGGLAMAKDGLFERWPIEKVFALHNLPGFPEGQVLTRPGPLLASVDMFDITLTGAGGHAAWPHTTSDPLVAAAQVLSAVQAIVSRETGPLQSAVVSFTQMHAGNAYNVIPTEAHLAGTIRTLDPDLRDMASRRLEEIATGVGQALGVTVSVRIDRVTGVVMNDPELTDFCAGIAGDIVGPANVDSAMEPLMGGDDFSYMADERPACYVFIGQGDTAALHTSGYDFNDRIIPAGVSYWVRLAQTATLG